MYAPPLGFTYGSYNALATTPDLGQDITAIGERLPDLPVSRLPSWIPGATTVQRYYADPATKAGTWIWLVGAATYVVAPRLLGAKGQQLRTAGGWAALLGLGSMALGSRKSAPAVVSLEVAADNALEAAAASEVEANANGCPGYGRIGYGAPMGPGAGGVSGAGGQSGSTSGGTVGTPPATGGASGGTSGSHGVSPTAQSNGTTGSYELQEAKVERLEDKVDDLAAAITAKRKRRNDKLKASANPLNALKATGLLAEAARLLVELRVLQAQQVKAKSDLRKAERLLEAMPKPSGRRGSLRALRKARTIRRAARKAARRGQQRASQPRSSGPMTTSTPRKSGPSLFASGGAPAALDTAADISDAPSESPVGDDLPETSKDDVAPETAPTAPVFQAVEAPAQASMLTHPVVLVGVAAAVGWGIWRRRK